MKQKISMRTKWTVQGWLLMLPSLIFLVGFTVYPVIRTLIQSFMKTSNNAKAPAEFIGFKNYINVFRDPVFAIVIKNTLKFSLIVIPLGLVIGFLLATLVSKNIKGIGVARALIFYPNVAPVVGFATIWTFLFTPNIGVISHVMKALSMKPVDFLNNPKTALYAIMAVYLWREASYMMIFYISGLQNISQEYYEAAHLDGASGWDIMRKITIPLVQPTTLFVLTITMADAFKMVDLIMVMTTKGGPNNSTNLLMNHIYQTAFSYWDTGQASVLTICMLGFMMVVALVQFTTMDKRAYYEN
ncbi:carbohydrate ABC transporter permease [Enterocloster asparagiformis]|uniref:carbohydrate ABC transporter permease n=1 Tax=Enterocloster asparagiformis TaxID=333367 RepID=UPI000464C6F2|nr:sugar ABC transporter permease [Enterocloster asparagiformis]